MKKEFVPYTEAEALKELGFDEPVFAYYESNELKMLDKTIIEDYSDLAKNSEWKDLVGAPLCQQAFRWFREKYDLFISIVHYENGYSINDLRRFETYEKAELECLKKLIELVKK